MNWNSQTEIKNKEVKEKNGLFCCVCQSWADKVRCQRCETKTSYKMFHYLCDKCFFGMTAEFHDKYVRFRKNKSVLEAKKLEKIGEKKEIQKKLI
jgi:hypothetical protein